MKVVQSIYMAMGENAFIYYDENSKEGVIFDPGGDVENIIGFVDKEGINIKAILLTHGHYDHTGGVIELKQKYNCDVACHELERYTLLDPLINLSEEMTGSTLKIEPDILFKDGDYFKFANIKLEVIHTPGHTLGGVCYYDMDNKVLFTGDTLFAGSVGRTDFPIRSRLDPSYTPESKNSALENMNMLIKNIKEKLFILDNRTNVYCGHGEATTIAYEKQNNPYLRMGDMF